MLATQILRELRHRWWIAALCVIGFVLLAKYVVPEKAAPATYQARMCVVGRIQLDENRRYREDVQDYYGTQMELMQSRTIQRRAHEAARKRRPEAPLTPVFLSVSTSPKSAVFTLSAWGSDPAYVELFLNGIMDEFLQYKRELRTQTADATLASISQQVSHMDAELNRAQGELNAFARTNSVAELQEQGSGAGSYLAELNRKLAELKLRNDYLSLLATNQSLEGVTLNSGTEPRATADLQMQALRELARLKAQQADLSQKLRPKHPLILQLENDIRDQEELVAFALQHSRGELRKTQVALALEIKNTEAMTRDWEGRALNASIRMAEYDRLKQNVARAERQQDYLLSMVRNVDLTKQIDQETITVLERAEPVLPSDKLQLPRVVLGGLAGLVVGLGVMLLVMYLTDRVGSADELDARLTVPVIGEVPEVPKRRGDSMPLLLESGDSRHCFAESIKSIRSALFYSTIAGKRPRSLLITSALPGEGKSTVALNLARAFAFSGYRVLLVDGDLRRSVLPRLLDASSEPGLSDVLEGHLDLGRAIVQTHITNLSFLPPGHRVNNPGELFLSAATDHFLARAQGEYDYVVIDSAPVFAADDTTSLAPKVQATLLVVRGSFTTTRLAQQALALLQKRQSWILGAICNRSVANVRQYNPKKLYAGSEGIQRSGGRPTPDRSA